MTATPERRAISNDAFRIAPPRLRRARQDHAIGSILAIILCVIVGRVLVASDGPYNQILLGAVILGIFVLGFIQFRGHARLVRRSQQHQVVVTDDCIQFHTEGEESTLLLTDILRAEAQNRWRAGPSLLLHLRNGRFVRLEGYENQKRLNELVAERLHQPVDRD